MKTQKLRISVLALFLAGGAIAFSGCAANKAAWGSMKKGMIMKYNYHPDKDLRYQNTFDFQQDMEVMDQQIKITANNSQLMLMKPLASKSNDLEFEVTIEEMEAKIGTPRGDMEANLEGVIGESFKLTLSPLGKELEYSGAEKLTYDYGDAEIRNMASDIMAFFPDLPDHPVKPGDSWESTDIIDVSSNANNIAMEFNNLNTFEGLETTNGYECMKVNVSYTGITEGKGAQDGMELITTGTIEGTSTWYFAYKEGIFVKQINDGTAKTETQIKGPQEMTLPATRKFSGVVELLSN